MSTQQHATKTKQRDTNANRQSSANRNQWRRSGDQTPHPVMALQRAMADPNFCTASDILTLQRKVGNQMVLRLVSQLNKTKDESCPAMEMAAQAKLTAGAVGDRYTQEANRVGKREDGAEPETGISWSGAVSPAAGIVNGGVVSQTPELVLQRKVGFEFQTVGHGTNVFVWNKVKNKYIANNIHDRDNDMIAKGEGFKVTADGGDLEFVTDAFEEKNSEKVKLINTMDRMQAYTSFIIEQSNRHPLSREFSSQALSDMELYRVSDKALGQKVTELDVLKANLKKLQPYEKTEKTRILERIKLKESVIEKNILLKNAGKITEIKKTGQKDKYKIYLPPDVTAHPQATVGVKLEEIFKLLKSLSDQQRKDENDGIGWGNYNSADQRTAVKAGVDEVENQANLSPKLKGFLALIASYARSAEATNLKLPNAKDATPVMSRTSLAEIFNKLDQNDQDTFRNLLTDKTAMTNILGRQNLLLPLFLHGTQSGTNFTIKEWLDQIANTSKSTDLLVQSPEDSISAIDQSYGEYDAIKKKYKINRPTDIGLPNVEGAIMELRAIKREVPFTEWKGTALAVFDLVRQLNGTENQQ